jgi:hypothetical protein
MLEQSIGYGFAAVHGDASRAVISRIHAKNYYHEFDLVHEGRHLSKDGYPDR